MKKTVLVGLALGAFALLIANIASANLIVNGSFEYPVVTDHSGQWEQFSSIDGWADADKIEYQSYLLFGSAADGNQYVELDSNRGDGNNWLVQTFPTVIGQSYLFSFAYSPRQGVSDNTLFAGVISYYDTPKWLTFGSVNKSGIGLKGTDWEYYTYSFTADWTEATVAFADGGPDDSYGTFLDDVSVKPVPEPATLFLFGTGLAGLIGATRRKKDNYL